MSLTRVSATMSVAIPVGSVIAYNGATAPSGYLLCDGSQLTTGAYPDLYAAIGTSCGSAGVGLFNIPDHRGRFLRGVTGSTSNDPDASSRTFMQTGGNIGNNVGSLQVDNFRSHNHADYGHAHSSSWDSFGGGNSGSGSHGGLVPVGQPTGTGYANIAFSGGNETRPVNAYVNYIIKY